MSLSNPNERTRLSFLVDVLVAAPTRYEDHFRVLGVADHTSDEYNDLVTKLFNEFNSSPGFSRDSLFKIAFKLNNEAGRALLWALDNQQRREQRHLDPREED